MAKGGNLGKASLVLTTKDGGLKKGLDKSEGGIKGWASGLKGKVGGALAGIGASIAAFATVGKVFENVGALADVGKQAAAIGIASDQFMGLSAAAKEAGVEGEQFGTLLQKGQLKIAEGSADTEAALGRIGLKLGDLRGLSADEQFFKIADGMQGVSDSGTRAVVASKLFEEEGLKLLPVLGRGSAGLKQFVEQQRAMGTAIGQSDMDGILSAQAKITQLGRRIEGFWNRITVAAAPFIEVGLDAIEGLIGLLPPFDQVKGVAMTVFRAVGVAGGYAWDTIAAGAGVVALGVGKMMNAFSDLVGKLGEVIELGAKLPDALGGNQFREAAGFVGRLKLGSKVGGDALQKWGVGRVNEFGNSAKKVDEFFDKLGTGKAPEKFGEKAGEKMAQAFAAEYKNNPAMERGSAEEYSARVRWEQQSQTLQQQQAAEAKKTAANTAAAVEQLKAIGAKLIPAPFRFGVV